MRADAGAPVQLFAAGSLQAALTEIAEDFTAATGVPVETRFGPSGLLRQAIENGAPADIFASADMGHPRALASRFGGTVEAFAANILCALVRPGIDVATDTLLERMLDPGVRLGISTPGADPSGDFAMELFYRAETVRPGAAAILGNKALHLTGSAEAAPVPPRRGSVYAAILDDRRADIFLTYRTNAIAALRDLPPLRVVDVPQMLRVRARYGLIRLAGAGDRLADRILSTRGQQLLSRFGFLAADAAQD